MDYDELVKRLETLEKAFRDHRHTGRDARRVSLPDQGVLTPEDTASVNATYDTAEQGVINNTRTRVAEIEAALKGIGILS